MTYKHVVCVPAKAGKYNRGVKDVKQECKSCWIYNKRYSYKSNVLFDAENLFKLIVLTSNDATSLLAAVGQI